MKRTVYPYSLFVLILFCACEKELKVDYDALPPRQVLICNFYAGGTFQVSLSASKVPDDYNPVNFLENATVDLYEDGVFIETLPYSYSDSSTGYGFYLSAYKAVPGKTYSVKTSDAEGLPGVSATEYLPLTLPLTSFWLEQYPDDADPNRKGIVTFEIPDEAALGDQYYASVFYRVIRPRVRDGDTTWVEDYVFNESPLSAPAYPNASGFPRLYFTDSRFNGQQGSFRLEFPGLVNDYYRSITFIFELSHIGRNYYDYYGANVPRNAHNINDGGSEPVPELSNIENGYGHFSGQNSSYVVLPIK